jgi:hypothetical protein
MKSMGMEGVRRSLSATIMMRGIFLYLTNVGREGGEEGRPRDQESLGEYSIGDERLQRACRVVILHEALLWVHCSLFERDFSLIYIHKWPTPKMILGAFRVVI